MKRRMASLLPLWAAICLSGPVQAESLVGRSVPDFTLKDYRGNQVSLSDFDSSRLLVLAFMGTQCPLAKLYSGRLQELAEQYDPEEVAILGLNANVQDSVSDIAAFVRRHGTRFPMLKDVGNRVADSLGAQRTPEVFLLDQNRVVRYHGRIDDQYVIGVVRDKPQREDLKRAVEELLAGRSVSVPATGPIGCFIGRVREADESSPVTYSNQIARIFQKRCVECHRDGEIAPFTLTSYEDVLGWGETIAEVVRERRMPPWHADPQYGTFENDCSLSDEDRELVFAWVEKGSPQGDPAELPEPPRFTSGWQLSREPDEIFAMAATPFTVAADAGPKGIAYQNFWVDPGFTEDKWIQAAEIRPGNRSVVHHIIVYVHPQGRKSRENSFLVGYVPGLRHNPLPPGSAKLVPAGSWLRFQVHYTPIGSEQQDLSSVGLSYADPKEVTQVVLTTEVANARLRLKPYQDDQEVTATSREAPFDLELLSMSPHMHLRGKSFRFEAVFPDGTRETLLDVPRYDFNWQTQYRLAEPKRIPAGARIHCVARYDNSEKNPANPDPSVTVGWGDQSWDEMMIGYMDMLMPLERFKKQGGVGHRLARRSLESDETPDVERIFSRLDADDDGRLSREEAEALGVLRQAFDRIDADGDGFLSREEVRKALGTLRPRDR